MVTSVFEVLGLQTQVVVLRFVTTMHGAQCVMTSGTILMPMWSADSLGLLQQASSDWKVIYFKPQFLYQWPNHNILG